MSRPLPSSALCPARHAGRLDVLVLQQGCSSRELVVGSAAAGAARACALGAVSPVALGAALGGCEAMRRKSVSIKSFQKFAIACFGPKEDW